MVELHKIENDGSLFYNDNFLMHTYFLCLYTNRPQQKSSNNLLWKNKGAMFKKALMSHKENIEFKLKTADTYTKGTLNL